MVCTQWFEDSDLPCDATSEAASGVAMEAIGWVFRATGSQFTGECTTLIRPTRRRELCDDDPLDLTFWLIGPILSIDALEVDGASYDPAEHVRVDHQQDLVALRGGVLDPWPRQDLRVNLGGPDSWAVTVVHGEIPPFTLLAATKRLACQLALRANGEDCLLPDNATSISDNGVTIQLDVPAGGKVGIPSIDSVVDLWRAPRARRRIWDPAAGPTRFYPRV